MARSSVRVLALLASAALGAGACRGGKDAVQDAAAAADAPADGAAGDAVAGADVGRDGGTAERDAGADDVRSDGATAADAAADRASDAQPDLSADAGSDADAPADAATDAAPAADAQPGRRAVQIAAGGRFTCALMSDGATECWGLNNEGQLGDGTMATRTAPTPVLGLPWAPQRLVTGWAFACAQHDGDVSCWGRNTEGQLGDGTFVSRPTPAAVTGLGDTRLLGTSGDAHHICAVPASGALKCWGFNPFGQLGDGTTTNQPLPTEIAGMTDVAIISCSVELTCIATAAGATRCWGGNAFGQLGDGTKTTRPQPIEPMGLGPVAALATGYGATCAVLRQDGAVWCWGTNEHGEIGDGTVMERLTPVPASGLSGAVSVAAGVYHSCALMGDGTVQCWGFDQDGEVGDGVSGTIRETPGPVPGITTAVAISAGDYHTCALLADGSVACWGSYGSPQTGSGPPIVPALPYGPNLVEGL
jgi:alpha-tubulin suppressor-like RCC1 family protein